MPIISSQDQESSATIELTPVIDIVFLLLIFFLVATTFHQTEREMQIALPAAQTAGPISVSLREIIVNVDAEGQIIVSGRMISEEDLRIIVEQAVEENPEQKVTVRGDKDCPYGYIVGVLDACKGAGIQEPYLDTVIER